MDGFAKVADLVGSRVCSRDSNCEAGKPDDVIKMAEQMKARRSHWDRHKQFDQAVWPCLNSKIMENEYGSWWHQRITVFCLHVPCAGG